jgi:hypothetical protein
MGLVFLFGQTQDVAPFHSFLKSSEPESDGLFFITVYSYSIYLKSTDEKTTIPVKLLLTIAHHSFDFRYVVKTPGIYFLTFCPRDPQQVIALMCSPSKNFSLSHM